MAQLPVALSVPVQFQDPGPLTSQELNENFLALVQLLMQTNTAVNALGTGGLSFAFNTALTPLVYNFGNYIQTPGQPAGANVAALQAMFNAITTGGYVWIPQTNFPVTNSSSGLTVPDNTIIQGLGTGGKATSGYDFFHFTITDSVSNGIFLNPSGPHNYGGIELRNLAFNWVTPTEFDTAINCNTIAGRIIGCTFNNCPTSVNLGGLQCTMDQCQINMQGSALTTATWIIMASQQGRIQGPSEFIGVGTLNHTAIAIGGGLSNSEKNVIRDVHLANPQYGIDFSDINGALQNAGITRSGCTHCTIDAVECQASYTAIYLAPSSTSTNANIVDTKILNSSFLKGQQSANNSPLVFFGGGASTNSVYGIEMSNCDLIGNVNGGTPEAGQYGLQIDNYVDSVLIDNCRINQFGTPAGSDGTANIAVTGTVGPGVVTISNCDLRAQYEPATVSNGQIYGNATSGSTTTQWAFLIPASATLSKCTIHIDNCNMTGFIGNPVSVAGTLSGSATLLLTDCHGYNDIASVVTATQPVTGGTGATTAAAQGYYGYSIFSGTNTGSNTTFTWGGTKTYTLTANQVFSFRVHPYDSVVLSQSVTSFHWIGV